MYPDSYYVASAIGLHEHPVLKGHERADVCVIGGGYTGLSAALNLAEQGMDVVLLEAERIGFGASGRNGGHVGSGQRKEVPARGETRDRLRLAVRADRSHSQEIIYQRSG
jgi:gamma-glutamylputrescine oxidase